MVRDVEIDLFEVFLDRFWTEVLLEAVENPSFFQVQAKKVPFSRCARRRSALRFGLPISRG
jgi:hypothetical protein